MIEINLLPKEYRKRSRSFSFDKKTMYVAMGAAAVVLLLAVVTFYQKYQLASLDSQINRASQQRMRLEKDIKVIDDLTDLKEKILNRMESIEKLDRYRSVWVDLLQDVNQRVPDFLWLTRIAEPGEKKSSRSSAKKNVPGQDAVDSVRVDTFVYDKPIYTEMEGYAFTLSSVASFLIGLNKSDYFEDIDLKWAKEQDVSGVSAYHFRVTCKMVLEPMDERDLDVEDVKTPVIAEK